MTLVNIYSLDDTEQKHVIASLSTGKHVIGRGALLDVSDRRVSRKHALIEVSNEKVTLTSVHINPCFFKENNARTLMVLKENETNELKTGDQFALLPENYWFRVKIDTTDASSDGNSKRGIETIRDGDDENAVKKLKTNNNRELVVKATEESHNNYNQLSHDDITAVEEAERQLENIENHHIIRSEIKTDENNELQGSDTNVSIKEENAEIFNASQTIKEDTENNKAAETSPIKEELIEDTTNNAGQNTIKEESEVNEGKVIVKEEILQMNVSEEALETTNQLNEASGSSTAPVPSRRERCWYASSCFRKNPNHRETFSHPGDKDYDPDENDNRPPCPFGTACYRKNTEHRRQFKHLTKPAPKPNPQSATPPELKGKTNSDSDDYDYNDPFIDDGSSDNYEPSDSDPDSDWEDSQIAESQERNEMIREAKRFIKNKK